MKVYIGLIAIPLMLAACDHLGLESKPGGTAKPTEIRELSPDVRKALGVGPDDFVAAVANDGHLILYKAPGKDFVPAEEPPSAHIDTLNRISILAIPGESKNTGVSFLESAFAATRYPCIFVKDDTGTRGKWWPSPPCPIK